MCIICRAIEAMDTPLAKKLYASDTSVPIKRANLIDLLADVINLAKGTGLPEAAVGAVEHMVQEQLFSDRDEETRKRYTDDLMFLAVLRAKERDEGTKVMIMKLFADKDPN